MKNLKKKALMAGSLVAAAAIAVGGTLAYANLSYDDEGALNTYTVGEAVDIAINEYQRNEDGDALEAFEQGKELLPYGGSAQGDKDKFGMPEEDAANYGDKIVTIKNTGKADAIIRVYIAQPKALTDFAGNGSGDTSDDALHWNWGNRVNIKGEYNEATYDAAKWGWTNKYADFEATIGGEEYIVTVFETSAPVAPGVETNAVMAGIYLDPKVDYDDGIWTMGDYVIGYDLSQGVDIPVYAEAVAGDFEEAPIDAFARWATTVKGGIVAAPESGAVRPAGYIPSTEGEVINSLVIVDESDAETNLRALYNGEGGSANYTTKDIVIKNSYLDGTYAMNLYAVDGSGAKLIVSNTELKGWISYTGFASAEFTNCTFDINSEEQYKTIRPYDTSVFTNCDFAADYEFLFDMLGAEDTITFDNCTIGGVAITDTTFNNAAVIVK